MGFNHIFVIKAIFPLIPAVDIFTAILLILGPMKQEERLREKIDKIKAALAADKKRWGGFYDDSRRLRYLHSEL